MVSNEGGLKLKISFLKTVMGSTTLLWVGGLFVWKSDNKAKLSSIGIAIASWNLAWQKLIWQQQNNKTKQKQII